MINISGLHTVGNSNLNFPDVAQKSVTGFESAVAFIDLLQNQIGNDYMENNPNQLKVEGYDEKNNTKAYEQLKSEKKKESDNDRNPEIAGTESQHAVDKEEKSVKKEDSNITGDKKPSTDEKISQKDDAKEASRLKITEEETAKDVDFNNLKDSLNRLIDVLNIILKETGQKEAAFNDKDIRKLLQSFKNNQEVNADSLLSKLRSLLSDINTQNVSLKDAGKLKNILAQLKKHITQNNNTRKQETVKDVNIKNDADAAAIKNLTARFVNMLESTEEKGNSRSSNDGGSASGNLSYMKFDIHTRRAGIFSAASNKESAFKANLDNIIHNARVTVKDGRNGSFSVKLYPRELGTVNINLGLEQGVIHGKFLVDNSEARDIIMSNLEYIKSQLQEAGITVGHFQVDVSDHREPYQSDKDGEHFPFISLPENEEISFEFESNSGPTHQGMVDLVI